MSLRDDLLKKAEEMAAEKLGLDPKMVEEQVNSFMGKSGSADQNADASEDTDDRNEQPARERASAATSEEDEEQPQRGGDYTSDEGEDDSEQSADTPDQDEADSETQDSEETSDDDDDRN